MVRAKTLALVVVVAILAVGLTAAYYSNLLAQKEAENQALRQQIAEKPITVSPANIDFVQTGGATFDFSAVVAADGSVATTTTKELQFDIINKDNKSANIVLTLKNVLTNKEGLPNDLDSGNAKDYVDVYIKVNGKTKYLFTNGAYTDGYSFTLGVAEALSGTLGVTFKQAPANTFVDGQTYTMTLFIYQPDANYAEDVAYTILT